jgi:hypothetical protein
VRPSKLHDPKGYEAHDQLEDLIVTMMPAAAWVFAVALLLLWLF